MGDLVGVLFNSGTTGHIEWASTGTVVDEVHLGADVVSIRAPLQAFVAGLEAAFPHEARAALPAYLRFVHRSCAALVLYAAVKTLPAPLARALLPLLKRLHPLRTTREVLSSLTPSKKLASLLGYQARSRGQGAPSPHAHITLPHPSRAYHA